MRYVAAYMLAVLGGKESPSTDDIEKLLSSVGIETDSGRLKQVCEQLKGKNIDELIAQGREKLSSMPCGGGVAIETSAAPSADAKPAAEEKKKEPEKEDSESDGDMGFGLFD